MLFVEVFVIESGLCLPHCFIERGREILYVPIIERSERTVHLQNLVADIKASWIVVFAYGDT
jgi:hypothetical protein